MKRLALTIALACTAPAFTACTTTTPVVQQQTATKAEYALEAAFNAAVTAEHTAKASGLLTGEKAAQADALVAKAYQGLLAARAAYNAGMQPDIANVLSLIAQLTQLINEAHQ